MELNTGGGLVWPPWEIKDTWLVTGNEYWDKLFLEFLRFCVNQKPEAAQDFTNFFFSPEGRPWLKACIVSLIPHRLQS